ncbi:MAG: hypothetical protein U9R72_04545 [Chloroflexota bacterium]|nr:hypothetical protein [Chloroflexota bacterium]
MTTHSRADPLVRYVALDVRKHYIVVGGLDANGEEGIHPLG